ncbi:hypothetical protein ACYX78_00575 [Advenella incenata]
MAMFENALNKHSDAAIAAIVATANAGTTRKKAEITTIAVTSSPESPAK